MKMKILTYLTICLIEECAEIIVRACKSLRFGWFEVQPGQDLNNVDRVVYELNDLQAVLAMMDKYVPVDRYDMKVMDAKREKVQKFMGYSRELGILEENGVSNTAASDNEEQSISRV